MLPQSMASALPATFKPSLYLTPPHLPRRFLRRDDRAFHPIPLRRAAAVSFAEGESDAFTKYSGYLFEDGNSEAEFLEAYDLDAIASIYRRKPLIVIRRLLQIGTTFGRWFAARYIDGLLERSDEMFKVQCFFTMRNFIRIWKLSIESSTC